MMETELYFKYSLFCVAPILWKARSFQQLYRALDQITLTLNNKMLLFPCYKTMLNCFRLDGQF